jgi:hypothetical protein
MDELNGLIQNWGIEALLLFFALAFLAEIIGTVGGFGSSVLFVPLAGLFMEFHEVLGLTALFHVTSNISKIYLFRKGFDKRLILYLGIPAVIFVIIGAYITQFIDAESLEKYLAFLLIGISLVFLLRPNLKIKPSNKKAIVGGVMSGSMAGILGTGGPIRGLTLAAFSMSKEVFIATSAFIDLGVDLSRSIVYTSNGFVSMQMLYLLPVLLLIGFTGSYIGKLILEHIPQERFKRLVLILILSVGMSMLFGKDVVAFFTKI